MKRTTIRLAGVVVALVLLLALGTSASVPTVHAQEGGFSLDLVIEEATIDPATNTGVIVSGTATCSQPGVFVVVSIEVIQQHGPSIVQGFGTTLIGQCDGAEPFTVAFTPTQGTFRQGRAAIIGSVLGCERLGRIPNSFACSVGAETKLEQVVAALA